MFLTMMFGEALAPPYTQRLLIGRNPKGTARGTILSGLFSIPFFIVTGMIGLTAFSLGVTDNAVIRYAHPGAGHPAAGNPGRRDGGHGVHHPFRRRRLSQRRFGGAGLRCGDVPVPAYVG